jgi:hypothetical protein
MGRSIDRWRLFVCVCTTTTTTNHHHTLFPPHHSPTLNPPPTQDDLVVSDKIEGLEPGQIHEVEEVRAALND